ncbi:hypothetical protein PRO82_001871 [Candidatus Protochlamydia amoebophila]|nr:hypothetical protein [Candidatus Protochlamydia amoebophila]
MEIMSKFLKQEIIASCVKRSSDNLASISVNFIGWVKLCGSYLMVNTHYKKVELKGDCVFQNIKISCVIFNQFDKI